MSIQTNTLAHIQEMMFDIRDLLDGASYKRIGYDNRNEMLEEFDWKLARVEEEYRTLIGVTE